jgi:hypothetical protein
VHSGAGTVTDGGQTFSLLDVATFGDDVPDEAARVQVVFIRRANLLAKLPKPKIRRLEFTI